MNSGEGESCKTYPVRFHVWLGGIRAVKPGTSRTALRGGKGSVSTSIAKNV